MRERLLKATVTEQISPSRGQSIGLRGFPHYTSSEAFFFELQDNRIKRINNAVANSY